MCYEEAAKKGHSGAQYNLGVLHYLQKLVNSDAYKGMSLIRQAASQGLQEAQIALEILLENETKSRLASSNSLSIIDHRNSSLNLRQIKSEPHDFCCLVEEPENRPIDDHSRTVSFYLGC